MGMAHFAPMDHYRRHFYVAQPVLAKLHEQFVKIAEAFRDDEDLANSIDAETFSHVEAGRFERIQDTGEKALLVKLQGKFEGLWVLVKNTNVRNGKHSRTIVFLMSDGEVMAKRNNPGRWKWETPAFPPMASKLGDKLLKAIDSLPTKEPPRPMPAPPARTSSTVVLDASRATSETRLVAYTMDGAQHYQEFLKERVTAAIAELVENGADPKSFRLFKEVKVVAKKVVQVDIEE